MNLNKTVVGLVLFLSCTTAVFAAEQGPVFACVEEINAIFAIDGKYPKSVDCNSGGLSCKLLAHPAVLPQGHVSVSVSGRYYDCSSGGKIDKSKAEKRTGCKFESVKKTGSIVTCNYGSDQGSFSDQFRVMPVQGYDPNPVSDRGVCEDMMADLCDDGKSDKADKAEWKDTDSKTCEDGKVIRFYIHGYECLARDKEGVNRTAMECDTNSSTKECLAACGAVISSKFCK